MGCGVAAAQEALKIFLHFYYMTNRIYELTDEQFINLIKGSTNISEVLFKLGYSVNGNSWGFSQVRRRMESLGLERSDFKGKNSLSDYHQEHKISNEELFKVQGKHNRHIVRKRILKEKLIPYRCSICGTTTWNGKILSLELDHINGINNDNRLENLRFLCPNCHSQTTTYGSRNSQLNESRYEISNELRELIEKTYNDVKSIKRVSSILNIRRKVVLQVVNESGQKHSNQRYVIRYNDKHIEIKRYGSLIEAAKDIIAANEVRTKRIKTCTRTLVRNKDRFWLNSYWKILDGSGIIHNPELESPLMDSEDTVDEAQV